MTQRQSARVNGFIKTVADYKNPLNTKLEIIITDFEPNGNKQGIPVSEAENIINSAPGRPLKINFDGLGYHGHSGAIPIGPIMSAYRTKDNGRDVIAAEAYLWNDIYDDVEEHLKTAFAEGIGTSWEIYFKEAEKDDNNVDWLHGCVFGGTCVVAVPAYGPTRTRVLAVAESLNNHATELNERLNMAQTEEQDTSVEQTEEVVLQPAESADEVNNLRGEISNAMELLSTLYTGFYNMLDETQELEQELATTDMGSVAEKFQKLVAGIQKSFDTLKSKAQTAEQAYAELKAANEAEAAQKALEAKAEERKTALSELGIAVTADRLVFYRDLADDVFNTLLEDFRAMPKQAVAETRINLPDPIPSGTETITVKDLAEVLRPKRG